MERYARHCTPYTFLNTLTCPEWLTVVEDLLLEHRERQFPPTKTLSMFLAQAMNAGRSCQNIVNEMALTCALNGQPSISSNTGSYCKARQRLSLELISALVRYTGHQMTHHVPTHWCWQGHPVRLIDGTAYSAPS